MARDADGILLTRIRLKNYKSIGACDIRPERLSFLVGPNGSGKSNFLDALRFVADSLRFSLDHALRERGGINEVRRRSGGHPTHFGVTLQFDLGDATGTYAFEIGAQSKGGYVVKREECRVKGRAFGATPASYRAEEGRVIESSVASPPPAASDRLYLVTMAGLPEFRAVYDALSSIGVYNLSPAAIRELQAPDPGDLLKRDGSNLAAVLARLAAERPEVKRRVDEYLASVVPGISCVESRPVGPKETLKFRQEVRGAKQPWWFDAGSMSDGTLRTLGVLVALFQLTITTDHPRLVGIEEPEIALHPAAASVLMDGLRDASRFAQILVTSHSPDLLDDDAIPAEAILAVLSEHGETRIGPLDEAGRSVLRDHLYTPGELLRLDQLRPDPAESRPQQLNLFKDLD
ncbi:MAG: AAA family ATPase [Planctomycetes bacterium]|nr:AAA family ATPase [Planctomycetota bacterium]